MNIQVDGGPGTFRNLGRINPMMGEIVTMALCSGGSWDLGALESAIMWGPLQWRDPTFARRWKSPGGVRG